MRRFREKAMGKVQVINQSGQQMRELEVPENVFSYPVNEHLLYESVVNRNSNRRRGTATTKTRGEVSGSNRKPWRQKGTGRARVGSIRNPLWRKGGIVFGPKPRDYHYKLPRQAKKNALRSALSLKYAENLILFLDELALAQPKTKSAVGLLKSLNIDSALLVDRDENKNLFLAVRNIPKVKAIAASRLNVYDVLNHRWLVITQRAFEFLMERFQS